MVSEHKVQRMANLIAGKIKVGERGGSCQRRRYAAKAVALQVQHLQACQIAPGRQVLQKQIMQDTLSILQAISLGCKYSAGNALIDMERLACPCQTPILRTGRGRNF